MAKNKDALLLVCSFLVVLLFASMAHAQLQTVMTINDINYFDIHVPNVYIVDLRKVDLMSNFVLKCASGPGALDLNLTFTGLNSKYERASPETRNLPSQKEVEMTLKKPLAPAYTGQYNCTALYEDGVVETVSWYIYFYPGKCQV